MIQKGVTRPIEEGSFESRKKYTDVQILLEDSEEVAHTREIQSFAKIVLKLPASLHSRKECV